MKAGISWLLVNGMSQTPRALDPAFPTVKGTQLYHIIRFDLLCLINVHIFKHQTPWHKFEQEVLSPQAQAELIDDE